MAFQLLAAGAACADRRTIEPEQASPKTLRSTGFTLLTPREREVAGLVSQGLTNRGIAGELGITPATAALHVEHVRGKLGFHSRAQIAAWTVREMMSA